MPASETQSLLHLVRAGGAPLMVFGLLARLPTAMTPMLLLIAIPVGGGSLVQAGSAVGLSALGTAASGAGVGLLIDRFCARRVVAVIAAVQSAALLGLAAQFSNFDDSPLLLPFAFVAVNGQRDVPVGGQQISLSADSSSPCPRSVDLPAG